VSNQDYDDRDEYFGLEPWERPEPSTAWEMPIDSDILIARDVGHARRVLDKFIDELYCRHVREMRGSKLPSGIFRINVKEEQNYVEQYHRSGIGIKIPSTRHTTLEMHCTYERAVEYMIAPGEVVSLDFLGVPGEWYAAVRAHGDVRHEECMCVVHFRKVAPWQLRT